jgi:hypothetical protein
MGGLKVSFIKKRDVNARGRGRGNIDICVEDKSGLLKKLFKKRC